MLTHDQYYFQLLLLVERPYVIGRQRCCEISPQTLHRWVNV
jgi:hypothetical protein